jgi:hypothetical protein
MASTTLLQSVSNTTCVSPCCCITLKASRNAYASPSTIDYCPYLHEVPAMVKLPIWFLRHQPTVAIFNSLWNPASTLHLYTNSKEVFAKLYFNVAAAFETVYAAEPRTIAAMLAKLWNQDFVPSLLRRSRPCRSDSSIKSTVALQNSLLYCGPPPLYK